MLVPVIILSTRGRIVVASEKSQVNANYEILAFAAVDTHCKLECLQQKNKADVRRVYYSLLTTKKLYLILQDI